MMPKRKPETPARTAPHLQDTVRLSAEGLGKVLGDLEARVMHAVWSLRRPVPARTVHERIVEEHEVAPLTVITVLNKLVHKGLLARQKRGGLFHYEARLGEDEFVAMASRRVVEGILSLDARAVAASLVDVLAERDLDRLAELESIIRLRLEQEKRG